MSAFSSVPVQWPGAGCMTVPGGLFTTRRAASSCTMSMGMGSASIGNGRRSATWQVMMSPGRTRWAALARRSFTVIRPPSIHRCTTARDSRALWVATNTSSRRGDCPAATTVTRSMAFGNGRLPLLAIDQARVIVRPREEPGQHGAAAPSGRRRSRVRAGLDGMHLLRLHVLHGGAAALEAGCVPDLPDPRKDLALLFLDVMLEAGMDLLDLGQPAAVLRIEPPDFLHQALDLLDLLVMVLLPFDQLRVLRRGVSGERLVEAGLLDLLVNLELGFQLLPELTAFL